MSVMGRGSRRWLIVSVLMVGIAAAGCSSGGTDESSSEVLTDGSPTFLAQCLDSRGDDNPPQVVCSLDAEGRIIAVSEIELASGRPFVTDPSTGGIAGVDRDGRFVSLTGDDDWDVKTDGRAFGFGPDGELWSVDVDGVVSDSAGAELVDLELDGAVEVMSGIDVRGRSVLMTVELSSGGFQVVIGDVDTGAISEIATADAFVGQAAWSPDGTKVALVGEDYTAIEIRDREGDVITEIRPDDPRLSIRMNAPRWIDDDTVVFLNASPAIVIADAATGGALRITAYDSSTEIYPVLPVPLGA